MIAEEQKVDLKTLPDNELVKKALAHDYEAFDELVNRYEDKLYTLTYKITGNQDDAKDALQDAFISMFKALDSFQGKSNFSTWAYRITTNSALMRLRARKKEQNKFSDTLQLEDDVNWAQVPSTALNITDSIAKDELKKVIDNSIKSLPPEYKTVFILRDVEKLSNLEVAKVLGISITAVKSRILRARLYMRNQLANYLSGKKI
ncbi:MAG: sigma-70 family RNA polymerase sigma factor [bacterium]|nr:sigma-70 family RNA polymerase sigma factor [bacterium]